MIGGRLTMRAVIERDTSTADDAWGNLAAPNMQPVGDPLACFVWSVTAREIRDGRKTAEVGEHRGMFAIGADLRADDEIPAVTDARGTVLIPGRLKVLGPPEFKHNHIEAVLRRIG